MPVGKSTRLQLSIIHLVHFNRHKSEEMGLSCVACQAESPKYKCSTCYNSYCSSDCWRKHKEGGECRKLEYTETPPECVKERAYVTEDTIPAEKLCKLGFNKDLKRILKDPLLQKLLVAVDTSSDPYNSIQQAMQDESFVQFVDICLKTVETQEF